MRSLLLLISCFTLLLQTSAVACQASGVTIADEAIVDTLLTYPNQQLLVGATELYERLESQPVFLIDAREEAGDSLIPGAVHFSAISKLTDPDNPVASYLIGPELFGEMMREIGLTDNDNVVIYDSGNSLASARLFYALDYYGFSAKSA
ncbi:MAG: hypothetical protein LC662_04415 [Rhodothermaceae bacterium]|nr:hypothetical protein [Rhodothermaceae bacterium]